MGMAIAFVAIGFTPEFKHERASKLAYSIKPKRCFFVDSRPFRLIWQERATLL
jgi:hypothetical protein